MNLTDNDYTALVGAFLEFLSQVVRSSPGEPPDRPYAYGRNKVIELPDAGYTLHLEATFVPRGAMVISPSGTPVQGPVAQRGGPGPAPEHSFLCDKVTGYSGGTCSCGVDPSPSSAGYVARPR